MDIATCQEGICITKNVGSRISDPLVAFFILVLTITASEHMVYFPCIINKDFCRRYLRGITTTIYILHTDVTGIDRYCSFLACSCIICQVSTTIDGCNFIRMGISFTHNFTIFTINGSPLVRRTF